MLTVPCLLHTGTGEQEWQLQVEAAGDSAGAGMMPRILC